MQAKWITACSPADPLSVRWNWHTRVFLFEKNARAVWWASSPVDTENCVLPALLLPLMPFSSFTFSLLFSPIKEQASLSDFFFFPPKKGIAHQLLTTLFPPEGFFAGAQSQEEISSCSAGLRAGWLSMHHIPNDGTAGSADTGVVRTWEFSILRWPSNLCSL